eukprot:COSAG03_NODE_1546_length_3897_cov_105.656925_6_plen_86_part_00
MTAGIARHVHVVSWSCRVPSLRCRFALVYSGSREQRSVTTAVVLGADGRPCGAIPCERTNWRQDAAATRPAVNGGRDGVGTWGPS